MLLQSTLWPLKLTQRLLHMQALEWRKQSGAPAVPPREQPQRLYSAINAQLAIARTQVRRRCLRARAGSWLSTACCFECPAIVVPHRRMVAIT